MFVATGIFMCPNGAPDYAAGPRGAKEALATQHDGVRRYRLYNQLFPHEEIVCPATLLRDSALARWVRKHAVATYVRAGEELAIAIANGIHPTRIVVHGAEDHLRRTPMTRWRRF
jgi:hypothetical protein